MSLQLIMVAMLALQSPQEPPMYGPRISADEATTVQEVVVRAKGGDLLLSATLGGDLGEQTFVSSAPIGLNCGGEYFRHEKHIANRQCWLRVRKDRTVLLAASDVGRYGQDWTVEWVGCTPRADGAMCELTMKDDASVGAVFRRLSRSG